MKILEIPIALQFFRLPPHSKLHPALPSAPAEQSEKSLQVELEMAETSFNIPSWKAAGNTEKADRNE